MVQFEEVDLKVPKKLDAEGLVEGFCNKVPPKVKRKYIDNARRFQTRAGGFPKTRGKVGLIRRICEREDRKK